MNRILCNELYYVLVTFIIPESYPLDFCSGNSRELDWITAIRNECQGKKLWPLPVLGWSLWLKTD